MPLKPTELLLAQHHLGSERLEVHSDALANSLIVSGVSFLGANGLSCISQRELASIALGCSYGTFRVLFYLDGS